MSRVTRSPPKGSRRSSGNTTSSGGEPFARVADVRARERDLGPGALPCRAPARRGALATAPRESASNDPHGNSHEDHAAALPPPRPDERLRVLLGGGRIRVRQGVLLRVRVEVRLGGEDRGGQQRSARRHPRVHPRHDRAGSRRQALREGRRSRGRGLPGVLPCVQEVRDRGHHQQRPHALRGGRPGRVRRGAEDVRAHVARNGARGDGQEPHAFRAARAPAGRRRQDAEELPGRGHASEALRRSRGRPRFAWSGARIGVAGPDRPMSFFDRLFRRKPSSTPGPASGPEKPAAPSTVKVWDSYGRLGQIPREQWRTKVLPATFQKQWNDAAGLAQTLTAALSDGFFVESLEAARQLHRIDPTPHRGATLLGVVLLQLKRFDEAARLLSKDLKKHGPDGAVLTNLAKARAGMGKTALADATLWTALEFDPNQSSGLMWYAAIQRERSGEAAEVDAFRRVFVMAGSWRAQLWLARSALKRRDTAAALAFYRGVLDLLKAVPADAFMQITGYLCNAGLVKEATDLCSSRFVAEQHGLPAGNNLVQAYVAQKDAANARRIL